MAGETFQIKRLEAVVADQVMRFAGGKRVPFGSHQNLADFRSPIAYVAEHLEAHRFATLAHAEQPKKTTRLDQVVAYTAAMAVPGQSLEYPE